MQEHDPDRWDFVHTPKELEQRERLWKRGPGSFCASHFQETLSMTSFDLTRATNEWRMLRNYARVWLPNVEAGDLWNKILAFKRQEFPNICALTEILISLSRSNSTVERGFSVRLVSLQLGSAQHCMDILAAVALQEGDIIDTYNFICTNSLTSSAFACQGNFTAALEKAELCCDMSRYA